MGSKEKPSQARKSMSKGEKPNQARESMRREEDLD
jgi:hypothetical protein